MKEYLNGDLLFDEEQHIYWYKGEKCISVTQILKEFFGHLYDRVPKKWKEQASKKGTFLHSCIEVYEKLGVESNELQEFRNYLLLKKLYKINVLDNEVPIVFRYKNLLIAGLIDEIIQIGEEKGICDLKNVATLNKDYVAFQTNLYKIGYENLYGEILNFTSVIHLKNEKRQFLKLPVSEEIAYNLLDKYIIEKGEKNE